ncbi:delta-sarcoglycan isoform X1 [Anolis carolinensis]|uniref:delta-sarcoglycan isoform X1 n=1 Tax=Anolis carolinensis TaxID=28377 RepID=UPI002F2B2309
MNILPKRIYLFQNLPIIRNMKIFTQWNKDIFKFIWKGNKPRIKYAVMTNLKKRGGFGVHDLKLYFEASALVWIRDWINFKKSKVLTIEGFDLRRGWHSYVWYGKTKIEKNFGNHFIRSALIRVWKRYKQYFYTKTPKWVSLLEANQRRLLGWTNWPPYRDLLKGKAPTFQLKSQVEIQEKYKEVTWLQYLQIKEYFNMDNKLGFSEEDIWEKLIKSEKKLITVIYNRLLEWSTETEQITNSMTKWARNIGRPIQIHEWEEIWLRKIKYTYASDLEENYLKMLHCWYMTPAKLRRMYQNMDYKCWKCKTNEGTFFHLWWTCKKTADFWKIIHAEYQKILKKSFPNETGILLIGYV